MTTSPSVSSAPSGPPSHGVRAPGQHARGTTPPSGPVLFARYAFGPNRLGLCGPEDWRSLLELGVAGAAAGAAGATAGVAGAAAGVAGATVGVAGATGAAAGVAGAAAGAAQRGAPSGLTPGAGLAPGSRDARARGFASDVDRGLRDLAARFEGAYPYLELIARAHGLADPMDFRVVDAYWIGNRLSDQVDPGLMLQSMDARFRPQLAPDAWRWLAGKPEAGARPTHAFHVFDVFPFVGSMRGGGGVTDALKLMDACRIRWGRVLEVKGDQLIVNAVPLGLVEGELALLEARPQSVRRWLDGTGFLSDVEPGDVVSLHWDWACEVLGADRLEALQRRTVRQLSLANQTI